MRGCRSVSHSTSVPSCLVRAIAELRTSRSEEEMKLCIALNEALDSAVSKEQLIAAVYAHDLGMAFVPQSILQKPGKLTRQEVDRIRQHISVGEQMLMLFEGWDEAVIVAGQNRRRIRMLGKLPASAEGSADDLILADLQPDFHVEDVRQVAAVEEDAFGNDHARSVDTDLSVLVDVLLRNQCPNHFFYPRLLACRI